MAGTHRLLAAAAIILLATGCGLSGQTAVNGPIGGNSRTATLPEGDSTLLFWGADAAVRGTVLDMGVSTEEDYRANGGYPVVSVRVDEILWLESPDPAFPFPKLAEGAQTKVIVRSPPSAAEDLKRGDPYVLFLSPGAYFSGPEGSVIAPD